MYHNYTDKRVILSTREPAENEFIFDDRVVFQSEHLKGIFRYIESISKGRIKWMRKVLFTKKNNSGIKIMLADELLESTISRSL